MSEQNPYAVLARIYDDAGFSNYTATLTPDLLEQLQKNGWMGKRILDLACGTGVSTAFFATVGMEVTGIELNPDMLEVARIRAEGTNFLTELIQGDIRSMNYPGGADMIYCIGNALNEMGSFREIEAVFQRAYDALEVGKTFVFDMITLRGLGEFLNHPEQLFEVSDRVLLIFQSNFSYETLSLKQSITVFTQEAMSDLWSRNSAFMTLRAYPHANLASLLQKVGFKLVTTYNAHLQPFDPTNDTDGRMIMVAEKQ